MYDDVKKSSIDLYDQVGGVLDGQELTDVVDVLGNHLARILMATGAFEGALAAVTADLRNCAEANKDTDLSGTFKSHLLQ